MESTAQGLPPKSTVHDYLELRNWGGTWSVFLMRSTWRCASRWDGKQARQQRLSIRRAQWVSNPTGYHAGKSAPKARVTYGGRFHPDSCRLIWKLTLAGCNASEVRAGLERVDADADPSFARGRPRGQGSNRHMHLFGLPGYWTRHVGMVMRVIGGDPSRSKVAASTSLMAVDRAGVGEGRTTIEAG